MATSNPYARSAKHENPYAVYKSLDGVWEWRILKLYQKPENAAKNEQAMAFMSVKGPGTFGSYDYGDTYLNDIHPTAVLVSGPDILKECGRR